MTTVALAIPHAAWKSERRASMARVRAALGIPDALRQAQVPTDPDGIVDADLLIVDEVLSLVAYREFSEKESNWEWSERMWRWMVSTGADFVLTLQDDDLIAPNFWPALVAMLQHLPKRTVLGLMSQHPACPELFQRGEHWVRTHSWAVGTGYGLWREDLEAFLRWRDENVAAVRMLNEDQMLNAWVGAQGYQTLHPNPTIVDHDTTIETNYAGNENDEYRTSACFIGGRSLDGPDVLAERMTDPVFWKIHAEPPLAAFPPYGSWKEYLKSHDVMQLVVMPVDARPLEEDHPDVAGAISLAISHTPWIPARVESMKALRGMLGITAMAMHRAILDGYREFTDRVANPVWSEAMWRWAAQTASQWCLFLQDDTRVAPRFWAILEALLGALPEDADVVGLQFTHPAAQSMAEEGVRLCTTTDALIGVAYVVRRRALREFLAWRATQLNPGWNIPGPRFLSEDTMLGLWCAVTGRKIYHPIPTPIDHDTSIASTYGNDEHHYRRPGVTWEHVGTQPIEMAEWWKLGSMTIPHLGRFYPTSPEMARGHVKGFTLEAYARLKADDGGPYLMGLKYRVLAKAYKAPKYQLFLATPHRTDGVRPEYAQSVFTLQRMLGLDVHHEMSLDVRQEHQDLVRVRSRMLRLAYESGASHLLFADGDNAWPPEAVIGMLHTGKDFVQCPYLRRDGKGYTIRPTEKDRRAGRTAPEDIQPDNTIEVEGTGLGLTLISRACMQRMIEHYGERDQKRVDLEQLAQALQRADTPLVEALIAEALEELLEWRAGHMGMFTFDLVDGQLYPTVNLFQLLVRDRVQLSEDTSFATRWRDLGGKVWLYIGNGSPIAHYGAAKYQGSIEDLGFARAKGALR
jgi:hypothetical protein